LLNTIKNKTGTNTWEIDTDGAGPVKLTGSTPNETTHHTAATSAADGTDAIVTGLSDLGLVLTGTSTSRTWKFWISVDGTTFTPVMGYNFETGTLAVSSPGGSAATPESWAFSVKGAKKFRCELDAVAGGNATAISEAVA